MRPHMTSIPRYSCDDIIFICIDLQETLLNRIPDSKRLVSRNSLMIDVANRLNLPYVVTSQYRKGLGEITPEVMEKAICPVLDKTSFSCGSDEAIFRRITESGRRQVVISGVETHICVQQTCLDFLRKDYPVAVLADAVGARGELDHKIGPGKNGEFGRHDCHY